MKLSCFRIPRGSGYAGERFARFSGLTEIRISHFLRSETIPYRKKGSPDRRTLPIPLPRLFSSKKRSLSASFY